MPLSFVEPPVAPKRNVLLYGPPKSGKTAGACSAPGPILLLNADLPNASWYAHERARQAGEEHLHEIEYKGFESLTDIGFAIERGNLAGPDGCTIETIVVDPVNELYRMLLEQLSDRALSPSLPTYQAVTVHMERFYRALCKNRGYNVVFVAHEMPVKDESTGVVERLAQTGTTNPSLGQKLMAMVDVIGYTAVVESGEKYTYLAQLVNAKGRRGGDRFDSLGPVQPIDLAAWFATGPQVQEAAAPPSEPKPGEQQQSDTEQSSAPAEREEAAA
jgi:hypothetical protein